jgi:hypothetical protein
MAAVQAKAGYLKILFRQISYNFTILSHPATEGKGKLRVIKIY